MQVAILGVESYERACELFIKARHQLERQRTADLLARSLDKRPSLEKRAYLAPFLVPIDVPAQYMVDNTVNGVYQSYRGLQQEFSTVHKQYDQLRSTTMAPKELCQSCVR